MLREALAKSNFLQQSFFELRKSLSIELQPAEVFFRCDSAAKSDSVSQSSVRLNAEHIWRGSSYKYHCTTQPPAGLF